MLEKKSKGVISKLANCPINYSGVKVEQQANQIVCTANGKSLSVTLHEGFLLNILNDKEMEIVANCELNSKRRPLLGTMIALTKNAISGLKTPFKKVVNLEGVGYKAVITGKTLTLSIGYSHPVLVEIPDNVEIKLETLKKILLTSIDKSAVGDFAAKLSQLKRYNPYKGSGVLVEGKFYRRKEVKKK